MVRFEEFDAAHQLLLACSLASAAVDLSGHVPQLASLVGDWDKFLESVENNQLRPAVASRLSRDSAGGCVPRPVIDRLSTASHALAGRGLFMAAELVRILDALHAAGIVAVALKGPAFAEFCGEGVGSRELTDLDVLIRPFDIEGAVGALSSIGYECPLPPQALCSSWLARTTWELPLIARHGATLLELHWSLAPRWFPAPVMAGDVIASAADRAFAGSRILWPAAEELFLIHVADGMKSGGVSIRWLGDLAALLRTGGIDWRRTRDIASRNAGLNVVRVALAAADTLSTVAATSLDLPELALDLPGGARALLEDVRGNARLEHAVKAVCHRLGTDAQIDGPLPHFRWSLHVADRRFRAAVSIARYVSGPTVADLAAMPAEGQADIPLRLRAFRRRLAANLST